MPRTEHDVFLFVAEDIRALERVKTRLYDGRTLSFDERRSLAAVIDGILSRKIGGDMNDADKARFAEKDRVFAENKARGVWPSETCVECSYTACPKCGEAPLYGQLNCPKCGTEGVRRSVCCMRAWHHVGDCCTHCGNDERHQ